MSSSPTSRRRAPFWSHSKEVRQKKSGDLYLSLLLGDRTGELDAKMWDNVADVVETFERDDFVRVKGLLSVYQNRPQLTIHKLQRVAESEVDPADFFPLSARDLERDVRRAAGGHREHRQPAPEGSAGGGLRRRGSGASLSAGRRPPSRCITPTSGVCWSTCSPCAELCRLAAAHYKDIDLDLLLAGALLHDVGKIHELSYDRSFGYTTEGQLLGHIMIGIRMIEEKLRGLPDFPPRLRTLVEHMVLSHHGQLDFGSPKVPLFPEAHAAPLPGRPGLQDGVRARADGAGPAGGGRVDRVQPAAGAQSC